VLLDELLDEELDELLDELLDGITWHLFSTTTRRCGPSIGPTQPLSEPNPP
jgi:hypothetical protein